MRLILNLYIIDIMQEYRANIKLDKSASFV